MDALWMDGTRLRRPRPADGRRTNDPKSGRPPAAAPLLRRAGGWGRMDLIKGAHPVREVIAMDTLWMDGTRLPSFPVLDGDLHRTCSSSAVGC